MHPDVAYSLYALGTLFIKQKQYLKASEALQKCFEIRKNICSD